ncbi:MAG: hypothetical protein ABRQ24_00040 [Syntrophomonadaceae bacterium]
MSAGNTNSGYAQTLEAILSEFQLIKLRLDAAGVELPPSCRFSLFEREIHNVIIVRDKNLPPSDVNWPVLIEGFRDTAELKVITSSTQVLTAGIPILRQIFSGTRLPSEDANSIARDKQFELYLASVLERTGFGVALEEPDIRFTYNSEVYSLAAKRIRSPQQIRKRYREAIRQIKRYPHPGFIGISLDPLVRGIGDMNIIAGSPDAMDDAGNTILTKFLQNDLGPQVAHHKDDQIIGLIASLVMPSLLPKRIGLGSVSVLRAIYFQTQGMDICKMIGSNTFDE